LARITRPVVAVGTFTVADAVPLPVIATADPPEAFLSETIRETPDGDTVIFSPSTAVAVDDVVVAALGVVRLDTVTAVPCGACRFGMINGAADADCWLSVIGSDNVAPTVVAALGAAVAADEAIVTGAGASFPCALLDCAEFEWVGVGAISSEGSTRWTSPRTAALPIDCAPEPIAAVAGLIREVRGPAFTDCDVEVLSAAVEVPLSAAAQAMQRPPATAVPIPRVTASIPTRPT